MLSADLTTGRDVLEGVLGCPTCAARYPIRAGVADFRDASEATPPSASQPPATEEVVRLAALLGLTEPGGVVVLVGMCAEMASDLLDLVDGVQVVALNGPPSVASGGGISPVRAGPVLPLARGRVRAFALDEMNVLPSTLDQAAAALVSGGRLLAPARAPVPDGVRELARDARQWVATRENSAGPVLQLSRVRR